MLRPVILLLVFVPVLCLGQKVDKRVVKGLQADVGVLASEALQGRLAGSEGERKAIDYLVSRYEKLKIPAYGGSYRHTFSFVKGWDMAGSRIVLGGQPDVLGGSAFPFPFSASGSVSGDVLIEVQEQGSIWLMPLYEDAKQAADPGFDWQTSAWMTAKQAAKDGATGVVFYDSYGAAARPRFDPLCKLQSLKIPVAFVAREQWLQLSGSGANMVSVALDVTLSRPERSAANVLARIDNKAARTLVITASLDGSRGEAVTYGANDNASGTAALLQLAEAMKKSRLRNYNLIFAHLSGSRAGQAGAAALRKELVAAGDAIAGVIDLYMIGRLSESPPALVLRASDAFPEQEAIRSILKNGGFREGAFEARCGGSDTRGFEQSGIPVLEIGGQSCESAPDLPTGLNFPAEARLVAAVQAILQQLSNGLQH